MYAYFKFARGAATHLAALLALCHWSVGAQALDVMDGGLQLHGFLTQGAVFTTDNNFFGESEDGGSLDFREIGVNLSLRPHPDFQVSGQLLSHRVGESDEGRVRVDYALVDWTAISGERGRGGVRLGRVKNPFGLYNKTRDVAFTRPSIILPQSIYFERTRNLTMAADGMELYVERYGEAGNVYVNLVAGWPQAGDKATEAALLGRERAGKFESDFSQLFQAIYEGEGGRYRLGITSGWVNVTYRPGMGDPLQAGHFDFAPRILSGQYNTENWSLTGEYALRRTQRSRFGVLAPDADFTVESYYLQGAYRIGSRWEALLRYDVLYGDRDDRNGRKFAAATGQPAFTRYAKDWTVGLRYDVTPAFMVRAEYHRVDGTAWLPGLDNPDPLSLERRWDMLMLLGSFRF